MLVGFGCAVVGYVVVASGALGGVPGWLSVVVVTCAVPTAPDLSRRLALNASITLGWTPLLWWVSFPVEVSHAGLLVGLGLGVLGFLVGRAPTLSSGLLDLLPTTRRTDLLVPAGGLVALLAVAPLALVRTPAQALHVLLPGVDNNVHFTLFTTMRRVGSTVTAASAGPDGTSWAFGDYPAGWHSVVATMSEITRPHLTQGADSLVGYAHALSLSVVIGSVVLCATVVSLPGLRDRPGLAAPALALTSAAFLWEPGQKVLADGFTNFWFAALCAGIALLISIDPVRPHAPAYVAAVAGLLVLVMLSWALLLVPAATAALVLLVDRDPVLSRRTQLTRLALVLAVLAVAALAALEVAVSLLATVGLSNLVSANGGMDGTSPLPTFGLLLVAFVVCLGSRRWLARRDFASGTPVGRRVLTLGLSPLAAVLVGIVLLVAQIHTLGTTSYYFLKYLVGVELVMAAFVPAVCAMLLAAVTTPMRRGPGVGLTVAATLAGSQAFGIVPGHTGMLHSATDDGTASVSGRYSRTAMSDGVLAAVASVTPAEALTREYLPLGPGNAAETFYPDAWYHAVNASTTSAVAARLQVMRVQADTVPAAALVARQILQAEPEVEIIVGSSYVEPLREALQDPALAVRVLPVSSADR